MDQGECWVCGALVNIDMVTDVMAPHKSKETYGLCAGSGLTWKDPIL
jgi:hypothetical protein